MRLREVLKNRKRKLDNKGAALVLVIVAMAFVGILTALVLWMAYVNYFMKLTDMRATDNFYSAEGIVEQIKTGLETEASSCIADAYKEVLSDYSQGSTEAKEQRFLTGYVNSLKTKLMVDGNETKYNLAHLCRYIDLVGDSPDETSPLNEYEDVSVKGKGSDINKVSIKGYSRPEHAKCQMVVSGNQITIKDLNVKYENKSGYVSVITTDFRINAPQMDFSVTGENLELFNYALVADGQILDNTAAIIKVNGSVYAGGRETREKFYRDAIVLTENADMRFVGGAVGGVITDPASMDGIVRVVSGRNISLGLGSAFETNEGIELFTDNISLDENGGKLQLKGETYVADDLTLNGAGGVVTLSNKYCGFGNGRESVSRDNREGLSEEEQKESEPSSSIIINGKNSQVDFSGLTSFIVAGRSYIGTSALKDSTNKSQKNVAMSESIAVRGNQIAYLVPAEALGRREGKSYISSNPMTISEYEDKIARYMPANVPVDDFVECDLENTCVPGTNIPIAPNYAEVGTKGYQKIFDQVHGLVYYYIVMEPAEANAYFEKYYSVKVNKDRINKYAKHYLKDEGIKIGDEAGLFLVMAGNYMTYENGEPTLKPAGEEYAASDSTILKDEFEALNHNLIAELGMLSEEAKQKTVYENYIDEDYLAVHAASKRTYKHEKSNGEKYVAFVSNGNIDFIGDLAGEHTRLIISGGDVNITHDFEGTVIAKGKININSGVEIKNVPSTRDDIAVLLGEKENDKYLYEYIIDGINYAKIENEEDADTDASKELVTYENWKKE